MYLQSYKILFLRLDYEKTTFSSFRTKIQIHLLQMRKFRSVSNEYLFHFLPYKFEITHRYHYLLNGGGIRCMIKILMVFVTFR